MEKIENLLKNIEQQMKKAVAHTEQSLAKIRAGKATPNMFDSILVDYYGNKTPLAQVATISTPDARTISIKPWEKSLLQEIEKEIRNSELGFNPQNDGENIRINIPMITEERRIILVKQAKQEAENGKINIRNARKDTNKQLKNMHKDGISEDEISISEITVQEHTDKYIKQIDKLMDKKENEIMQV